MCKPSGDAPSYGLISSPQALTTKAVFELHAFAWLIGVEYWLVSKNVYINNSAGGDLRNNKL